MSRGTAKARAALSELPSVYQAVGTTAARAKKCAPHTKRGHALWNDYIRLGNQGAELTAEVRQTFDALDVALAALDELATWHWLTSDDGLMQTARVARMALKRIRGGDGRPPKVEEAYTVGAPCPTCGGSGQETVGEVCFEVIKTTCRACGGSGKRK